MVKPGVLQSMGLQRVGHGLAIKQQTTAYSVKRQPPLRDFITSQSCFVCVCVENIKICPRSKSQVSGLMFTIVTMLYIRSQKLLIKESLDSSTSISPFPAPHPQAMTDLCSASVSSTLLDSTSK